MLSLEELVKMTVKELAEELNQRKFELLKHRLEVKSRQNNQTAKLKTLRRYIARIRTIKRWLEMERVKENAKSNVITK